MITGGVSMKRLRSVCFNAAFGLSMGVTVFNTPAQAFFVGEVTRTQHFMGEASGPLWLNLVNRQRYHARSSVDAIKADMRNLLDQNQQAMRSSPEAYFVGCRGRAFPNDHFELAMVAIESLQDKDAILQAENRLLERLGTAKSIHFHAGPYYVFGFDRQHYASSPFTTGSRQVFEFQVESTLAGVPVLAFLPLTFLSEMAIGRSEHEDLVAEQIQEPYLFPDR
jgi:hypothetical protein